MDVAASLVAGAEALVLVQPGECALDDPAHCAESGAVGGVLSSDARGDSLLSQGLAVVVVVVATVTVEPSGPLAGPPALATNHRDRFCQREQLGDIVAVSAGQRHRQRETMALGDQVVLGEFAHALPLRVAIGPQSVRDPPWCCPGCARISRGTARLLRMQSGMSGSGVSAIPVPVAGKYLCVPPSGGSETCGVWRCWIRGGLLATCGRSPRPSVRDPFRRFLLSRSRGAGSR